MSKKCLAIGVSSVDPVPGTADKFAYLDGAVVAAETIGQWALSSGFAADDVVILTDKGSGRVRDTDLQDAFDRLLPQGTTTDHFVLSFAGHGLTGINDDTTYWLMSDSLDQGYQIFVEDLRRQLYAYGIEHLTIFSDACRSIANSQDLRGLLPRPGVRKRHGQTTQVDVARFNACQDATSAFMVRVPGTAAPGKCIFSGVLAEALWGRIPEAIDGSIIDSSSLGRGLRAASRARATQYSLTLVPGGSAFFDKVVYFDKATPPTPPNPDLAPWPPSAAAPAAAPKITIAEKVGGVFTSVLIAGGVRGNISGIDSGFSEKIAIGAVPALRGMARSIVGKMLPDKWLRTRAPSGRVSDPQARMAAEKIADQIRHLQARKARTDSAGRLSAELQRTATGQAESDADLTFNAAVKQIWAEGPIDPVRHKKQPSFMVDRDAKEGQLLVEFTDGLFAPLWYYPDLACAVIRDAAGVAAVSYRSRNGGDDSAAEAAIGEVIAGIVTGQLSATELDDLATKLRHQKHVNPVFGAIAAYCYDVTGDLNSIRRMAAHYAMRRQSAPYDIVFMGLLESNARSAAVPAVPEDQRRPKGVPDWLKKATRKQEVSIAGRCPWLRQGWDFLASPEDIELPLVDGLMDFRRNVAASTFTTFDREGGERIVEKWGLQKTLPG